MPKRKSRPLPQTPDYTVCLPPATFAIWVVRYDGALRPDHFGPERELEIEAACERLVAQVQTHHYHVDLPTIQLYVYAGPKGPIVYNPLRWETFRPD